MCRTKLILSLILSGSAFGQVLQGVTLGGVSISTTVVTQGGGGGGSSPFAPTTTLSVLTSNNTSTCPSSGGLPAGCNNTFTGLTDHSSQNGNGAYVYPGPPTTAAATNVDTNPTVPAAGNVSTVSPFKMLYPGFGGTITTKLICHYQPWWGGPDHITNIGQDETNASLVARQANDMIARGCTVIMLDWYGQSRTFINNATLAWRAELDSRCSGTNCPLYMALMEDGNTPSGRTEGGMETDLSYAYSTYMTGHNSYWKITDGNGCGSRPVVITFGWTGAFSTTNWGHIKTWIHSNLATCTQEPVIASEGQNGLTDANQDGAYNWIGVNDYDNASPGSITSAGISGTGQFNPHFLTGSGGFAVDDWYAVAKNHTAESIVIGAAYAGFNDTNADWGFSSSSTGQGRKVSRQCGTVWVNSWKRPVASGNFSSGTQIPAMGMVVWNDYEEGTAIEPGIDNCYTVTSPSIVGSNVNWTMTASSGEASTITIDHFSLWLFDGVGNGQDIADVFTPSATTIAIPATIPAGTWTLRVQMVGVNSIQNRMSSALTYIK